MHLHKFLECLFLQAGNVGQCRFFQSWHGSFTYKVEVECVSPNMSSCEEVDFNPNHNVFLNLPEESMVLKPN